jgi:hypothetical protein
MSALERNEPSSRVAQLAGLALSQGWLIGHGSFQLIYAVQALIWIDRVMAAARACDQVMESAERAGSVTLTITAHACRPWPRQPSIAPPPRASPGPARLMSIGRAGPGSRLVVTPCV